ncbi:MAG: hypothetical protein F6K54_20605 [Okeania sp. SIO3B5]|uniref:hypothetical protein n=1 Tax=Okeania sp. SIO3B5 TaxID=2607811 RepID=UPI0014018B00|nr:hypothetical protein [Okeania sp. SIO3B5]NEO55260.1 hypothetical protein [Okeania sp. SIO3B5]
MRCLSLKLLGGGALRDNVCYQRWQWEHLAPVPGIPFCFRIGAGFKSSLQK